MSLPAIFITLASAVSLVVLIQRRNRQLRLPPSPPGWPILGNLLQAPTSHPWKRYQEWTKELDSDIIHLDMATNSVLVLNSHEAVVDLLERRSNIYSGRPPMPMVDLAGWGWNVGFMPYGPRWRAHRKMFHSSFHENAAKDFRPHLVRATQDMLLNLYKTPKEYIRHIRSMNAQVILTTLYGFDAEDKNTTKEKYVRLAEEAMDAFGDATAPGRFLVNMFPSLVGLPEWFPGVHFKRDAARWRDSTLRFLNETMDDAVDHLDNLGESAPISFLSNQLGTAPADRSSEHYETVKNIAGVAYGAAMDTTLSALSTFILAMVLYPDVQKRAQDELDSVVPTGELPSFDDETSLPYLTAVLMETLRWQPAVPLTTPHYTEVEDEYRGYRIPAKTTVLANAWALLHDERDYPDPHTFNPGRFLTRDGKIDKSVRDPAFAAFGFGRRNCAGRHFARSSAWISMAFMLRVFDIRPAEDENGVEVIPGVEYTSHLVSMPMPFECRIEVRNEELLRRTS